MTQAITNEVQNAIIGRSAKYPVSVQEIILRVMSRSGLTDSEIRPQVESVVACLLNEGVVRLSSVFADEAETVTISAIY
jgi:hypothetical protein